MDDIKTQWCYNNAELQHSRLGTLRGKSGFKAVKGFGCSTNNNLHTDN